ncbi:DUF4830 domain-containing protein [Clostridium sp. UBA6640]|uniref:DUF4830 domain-containing protein n=1 Tax=Clostridium sp. UBA6640 TaxID=1946370 RepID=UPI0025BBCD18|nr:DUF4830 domain-containing protein [Clostridium sp. UBA6640]
MENYEKKDKFKNIILCVVSSIIGLIGIGNKFIFQNNASKFLVSVKIFLIVFLLIIYPIVLYRIYRDDIKTYNIIPIIIIEAIFCIILCFSFYKVVISSSLEVGIYLDIFYILGIVSLTLLVYLEEKITHESIRKSSIIFIFILLFVLGYFIYAKYAHFLSYEKQDIKVSEFKIPRHIAVINEETYDRTLIIDKKIIEDLFSEMNPSNIQYIGNYKGISDLKILEEKTTINRVNMDYGADEKHKSLEEGYIDSIRLYDDKFSTIVVTSSNRNIKYQYKVDLSKEIINKILNAPNEVLPFENHYKLEKIVKEHIDNLGYKIIDDNDQVYYLKLPENFNYIYNNYNIGSFLKDKNELSKKNGYDFSKYMGEDVKLFTYKVKNNEKDIKYIYFFLYEDNIIGIWQEDRENADDLSILKAYTKEVREHYTFKDLNVGNMEDLDIIRISKNNKKYKTIDDKNEVNKFLKELNKCSLKSNEDIDKDTLAVYYHVKLMNSTRSNLIDIKRCEQNILIINNVPYSIINGSINFEDIYYKGKDN